jgi:putative glycosyltransferase (TIGR04372 family)
MSDSLVLKVARFVCRILGLRIVRPGLPNRIGHLVLDFESYIKERLLQGRTQKPLYIVDDRVPCNRCMLDYWRTYIRVIEGSWARPLQSLNTYGPLVDNLEHRYAYTLEGAASCFAIESAWGDRLPLFVLGSDHARRGEACLAEMGLPPGAWFVCVHARSDGFSPGDEFCHRYRNVSIKTYFPAMEDIVRRGGWCIRVGDPSMEPLPSLPQTIDYARSSFKSDWMDVFLGARCRFFLGSSSGLFLISSAFGVPSALTNMAPMACAFSVFRRDISIPKLILASNGSAMSFPALLSSPIGDMRFAEMFDAAGVTHRANTSEEIRELVTEMLDRLEGTYVSTKEDEARQTAFKSLFHDGHYSYKSCARICDAFLRRHENLFSNETSV